jgi:hypothetical protein
MFISSQPLPPGLPLDCVSQKFISPLQKFSTNTHTDYTWRSVTRKIWLTLDLLERTGMRPKLENLFLN